MKLQAIVHTTTKQYSFTVSIHAVENVAELRLHPTDFYLAHGKKEIEFPHYEMEITDPPAQSLERKEEGQVKLHVFRSIDGKDLMVCYPRRMANTDEAEDIFQVWCLGTVYTLEHNIDFEKMYKENGLDVDRFSSALKKHCGIELGFLMVVP
jgi:hypothetical protein